MLSMRVARWGWKVDVRSETRSGAGRDGEQSAHAASAEPPNTVEALRALLRMSRWRRTSRSRNDVRARGFGFGDMVPAVAGTGEQFVGLLRDLEPEDGGRPVPGMAWTVAETATHMLTILRRAQDPRRSDTLDGLAQLNALQITEIEERELRSLADLIEGHVHVIRRIGSAGRVLSALRIGRWINFPLHVGLWADVPTASSYVLFDLLAHGDDIARATGRPWTIAPDCAALVLRSSLPALLPWVSPEALDGPRDHTTFTFPDADDAFAVGLGDGDYTVQPVARRHATVELDPVDLFLAIAGRREPATDTIARISAWYQPI